VKRPRWLSDLYIVLSLFVFPVAIGYVTYSTILFIFPPETFWDEISAYLVALIVAFLSIPVASYIFSPLLSKGGDESWT